MKKSELRQMIREEIQNMTEAFVGKNLKKYQAAISKAQAAVNAATDAGNKANSPAAIKAANERRKKAQARLMKIKQRDY